MKRNLKQLAKELAAELLAGDRSGNTGTTILAYYEPRNGTPRRVVRVIENAGDPYKAAEQAAHKMPTDADAVLLTCAGWAAPNDDDQPNNIPPSQHPKRLRCALVVARTLTRKTPALVSALALTGDDDIKTNDDTGTGTGPLADAMNQLADHLTNR